MLINPTEEQEFFRATTERFLVEHVPPDALRGLRDDPAGFDRDYWRRGAELGWTSLLVDEAHGGGSISGAGLVDLSLVAYEFGHHTVSESGGVRAATLDPRSSPAADDVVLVTGANGGLGQAVM